MQRSGSYFLTIAIALGIVFGICSIPLPSVASKILELASDRVGPLSMIVTGLVISTFSLKELLPDIKTVIFSLIRLIAIPSLLLGICFLCEMVAPLPNAVYPAVVIMGCMPCGLNTIVFPSLVGEDCRMGAKFVLLSHVLCLASIPLWIWIVT